MGMVEDAYRKRQVQAAADDEGRKLSDEFAARQHREMAEFIVAMRQLGVAPRAYACFVKEPRRGVGEYLPRRLPGVAIQGWHVGPWDDADLANVNVTPEAPKKRLWGSQKFDPIKNYLIVAVDCALHSNQGPVHHQLPYVEPARAHGDSDPDHLSNSMPYAIESIVKMIR